MVTEAAGKAIGVAVLFCGALIAAFYFAYLLLLVLVLGGIGIIAYFFFTCSWFKKDEIFPD